MRPAFSFREAFERLHGNPPFPWQERLYDEWFLRGKVPPRASLPTGIGKTSVIGIWMIALASGASLPRRLVYVVNRRTVVDQTTAEVTKYREAVADLPPADKLRELVEGLGISTLRGQFADNREWSADPSRPAVICGTVDMIGSRLLFSGYRAGYKSRPLYAGFLGQDALIVHDEAHLEPAFQQLIEAIQSEQRRCNEFGRFEVLELSATVRGADGFGLDEADYRHSVIQQRVGAHKQLLLHPIDDEKKLPEEIARLALEYRESQRPVVIFVRSVRHAEDVAKKLLAAKCSVITLSGTMRGKERDELVERPEFQRFLHGAEPGETVYLVCTSAGEVGVNLSAGHLVCDLSTFDSMAQRFGRVNRFGEFDDAQVTVVHPEYLPSDKLNPLETARKLTLDLLQKVEDASPQSLNQLNADERTSAFAPAPKILPCTDILFDAWSLTTIQDSMPGRPPVEDYLHGVADDEWEPPQTEVAWREEVEWTKGELLLEHPPAELLEVYPLKPHEILRDRTDRVRDQLRKIATRHPDAPVWIVHPDGSVDTTNKLVGIVEKPKPGRRDEIDLRYCTVLLTPSVGGLSSNGTLDGDSIVADDVADDWFLNSERTVRRRIRLSGEADPPAGMRLVYSITRIEDDSDEDDDGGEREWNWYSLPRSADDEGSRSASDAILLDHHIDDVVGHAERYADRLLSILPELKRALVLAARVHDLGKRRDIWQRSIGNQNPGVHYAKSGRLSNGRMMRPPGVRLSAYRHEFGSLLDVLHGNSELNGQFEVLGPEGRDLVLHLVAAHHGRGRPCFPAEEIFDPNYRQSLADAEAVEVARRFARLQRQYGRWGLAYLESLLRAADWAASADPTPWKESVT